MTTDTTRADRAHAVVAHALDGDGAALDVLLASLDAPELRRLLAATVGALTEAVIGRAAAAGVPRRQAAAWFRATRPRRTDHRSDQGDDRV